MVNSRLSIFMLFVLFSSFYLFSQKETYKNIIQLDSTWGKELFPFPIGFAQNINYKGTAEVRFPPKGWSNPKHPNFWSYTYAWSIQVNKKITESELTTNLEKYFDGLNRVDLTNPKDYHRKTKAVIVQINEKSPTTFYKGHVVLFDRFATHKRLTLHVLIESNYCSKQQKTVILFKFSPKEFNHETWEMLRKIRLVKDFCAS